MRLTRQLKILTLPTYTFYPAEVVVPDYVDISEAKFPKQTKITKVK